MVEKCPNCGTNIDGDFCTECGTNINSNNISINSRTKICPKCGTEVNIDLSICPTCFYNFIESNNVSNSSNVNDRDINHFHHSKFKIAISVLISLFLPGLGHFIFKDYKKGVLFILTGFFLEILLVAILGFYGFGFVMVLLFIYNLLVLYLLYKAHIK